MGLGELKLLTWYPLILLIAYNTRHNSGTIFHSDPLVNYCVEVCEELLLGAPPFVS
jgi:hypothetical protein